MAYYAIKLLLNSIRLRGNFKFKSRIALDGIENCVAALKDIENGKIHKCFLEMSACNGSCIGGPVTEKNLHTAPIKDFITIANYAGKKDF